MKRQAKDGTVAQVASDAVAIAEAGAEVIGAGVLLTGGIVLAAAELAAAKLFLAENTKAHAPKA